MSPTAPEKNQLIEHRVEDGLCVIELNDPPANTYSYDMMRQLDEAILAARMDESVHVILIRGKGEKFFCAGANIGMLSELMNRDRYGKIDRFWFDQYLFRRTSLVVVRSALPFSLTLKNLTCSWEQIRL